MDVLEIELRTARETIARKQVIDDALTAEAKALAEKVYELVHRYDAIEKRKPPATMAIRRIANRFGPRIYWVKFTNRKRVTPNGPRTLVQEIPGRSGLKYPKHTFRGYQPELREEIWACELEAFELRKRTKEWDETFKHFEKLIAQAEAGEPK